MLTDSERQLKLRFLHFARSELLRIAKAQTMFRRDYWRLTTMIGSMHLSGYLTRAQATALGELAANALDKALSAEV